MLSPLPRHSGWRYCFAHFAPVVSAFPDIAVRSARALSFSRLARRSLELRRAHLRNDAIRQGWRPGHVQRARVDEQFEGAVLSRWERFFLGHLLRPSLVLPPYAHSLGHGEWGRVTWMS